MAYDVSFVRGQFPFFAANPRIVYLDSAATALKPQRVIDATVSYYASASVNPHNADSPFADAVHADLAKAREAAAAFMGAGADETIFAASATDALNLFASGLDAFVAGGEIVVPVLEHTSNLLPWLALAKRANARLVPVQAGLGEDLAQALLARVSPRAKLVAYTAVSNLFGTSVDFMGLAGRIKAVSPGACVVVDATQAAPHGTFSLRGGPVDLLAFSAHKVYGPTGVGVGFVSKRAQTFLEPARFGGGMSTGFDLDRLRIAFRPFPQRYEAGTPNAAGILAAGEAFRFFLETGPEAIAAHERAVTKRLIAGLSAVSGVSLANAAPDAPIAAFNVAGWHPEDVARCLGAKGIIVRAGTACVDGIRTLPDAPHAYVRASIAAYTSETEADALVAAVKNLRREDAFAVLAG